ncbi:MucR family transcriptional regulator [Methylobacterium durans]|uniref:MucR family transcriptional regulator n=1 Tax=Methylobacterium durans TaxID=2202825 RepID=UPI002689403C
MEENTSASVANYIGLATDIVSAYVSNNSVRTADLPDLITSVHAALAGLSTPADPATEQVGSGTDRT